MSVVATAGALATVTIDDERTRNALGLETLRSLAAELRAASEAPGTRVLLLRGAHGRFSSGGNVKEVVDVLDVIAATQDVFAALDRSPVPVVAVVEGPCLGLALGVAAACDLVVASEDAFLSMPEAPMGQVGSMAALRVVPRVLPGFAARLMLTAETVTGAEAARHGLVDLVAAAGDLDVVVRGVAEALLAGGPAALRLGRDLIRAVHAAPWSEQAERQGAELTARLGTTPEALEGALARAERRTPDWVPVLDQKD